MSEHIEVLVTKEDVEKHLAIEEKEEKALVEKLEQAS